MLDFDAPTNDCEALLRHCREFKPQSGDPYEDSRLAGALEELAQALEKYINTPDVMTDPDNV